MEQIETYVNNLRKYIKLDATMLPSFVDNKDIVHRNCIDISIFIFEEIYKLTNNKILSKQKIATISNSINVYLNEMSLIDFNLSILYYEYFRDSLTMYVKYGISAELWEICTNIRSLYESIYKEKMNLDDED